MTLLPGFALIALATAGLFFSIWTVRQRALLLAGVLVSGALTMGTKFFGGTFTYVPLFDYLPGWQGIRTPSRLILWATIFLAILAAGAVSATHAGPRTSPASRCRPAPACCCGSSRWCRWP